MGHARKRGARGKGAGQEGVEGVQVKAGAPAAMDMASLIESVKASESQPKPNNAVPTFTHKKKNASSSSPTAAGAEGEKAKEKKSKGKKKGGKGKGKGKSDKQQQLSKIKRLAAKAPSSSFLDEY